MNKTKKDNIYFFWSASIILCIFLAVFVLMFTSCSKPEKEVEVSPNQSESFESPDDIGESDPSEGDEAEEISTPGIIETVNNGGIVLAETEDMGQEYIDKFVFLGDSTTYGLAYYDSVPVSASQVWTPANGTLTLSLWSIANIVYEDGREISIADAAALSQPEYLMITLGVNGISFMDEDNFIEEYTNLVKAVQAASPNTKIILNSIYPISADYPASNGITNEKIDTANLWVQKVAENLNLKYLNSASVIKDEYGALPKNLDNGGDGLHMNGDGYNLVIGYMRSHGYN
ncbi:MAG: hypothetical protein GX025_03180 [Clostridiales bacterium]|nr:hypothetical protein [Clostridiales bacterium]